MMILKKFVILNLVNIQPLTYRMFEWVQGNGKHIMYQVEIERINNIFSEISPS